MQSESRNFQAERKIGPTHQSQNIGRLDRLISTIGGAGLIFYGLMKPSRTKTTLTLLTGGALICRGATGHSMVYKALGIGTAGKGTPATTVPSETGLRVDKTIIIERPASELY